MSKSNMNHRHLDWVAIFFYAIWPVAFFIALLLFPRFMISLDIAALVTLILMCRED